VTEFGLSHKNRVCEAISETTGRDQTLLDVYPRKSNFSSGSLQTRVFVSFSVSFVMMQEIVVAKFLSAYD
jgi:hypothetical protein